MGPDVAGTQYKCDHCLTWNWTKKKTVYKLNDSSVLEHDDEVTTTTPIDKDDKDVTNTNRPPPIWRRFGRMRPTGRPATNKNQPTTITDDNNYTTDNPSYDNNDNNNNNNNNINNNNNNNNNDSDLNRNPRWRIGSPMPTDSSSNTSAYTPNTTRSTNSFSLDMSPADSDTTTSSSEPWAASAPALSYLSLPRPNDNADLEQSEAFPDSHRGVQSNATTPAKHNDNQLTVDTRTPPHRHSPLTENMPPLITSPPPLITNPISPIPQHSGKYPTYLTTHNLTPMHLSPPKQYHPYHYISSNKTLHY